MRLLMKSALVAAALLMSATTASAVSFTLQILNGSLAPGDSVELDIIMDTAGGPASTAVSGWFLQVNHAGNTASAATQPGFLFLEGQLFSPIATPVPNSAGGGTATGQYAIGQAQGVAVNTAPVSIGTISFDNLVAGTTISVFISEAGGAVAGQPGQNLFEEGLVEFGSVNVVPEPSTALLVGLGLAGLGFAGRRR